MPNKQIGTCLCGACKFTATLPDNMAGVCHCGMCRKWSGGMFISTSCAGTAEFETGAPVKTYQGSDWGERVFCGECGSTLMWQSRDKSTQYASIHCFENPAQFDVVLEIFHDKKPANYALRNETRKMTETEVFAAAAAGNKDLD